MRAENNFCHLFPTTSIKKSFKMLLSIDYFNSNGKLLKMLNDGLEHIHRE